MREIVLNKGYVALVDDEDYERLSAVRWYVVKQPRGVYVRRTFSRNGSNYYEYLHQAVIGHRIGLVIDHIDGDALDNRRENLRHATRRQNCCNMKMRLGAKSSQYKGVTRPAKSQLWIAQIRSERKLIHLGSFTDEREAAAAYNEGAVSYHGEFARLNEL